MSITVVDVFCFEHERIHNLAPINDYIYEQNNLFFSFQYETKYISLIWYSFVEAGTIYLFSVVHPTRTRFTVFPEGCRKTLFHYTPTFENHSLLVLLIITSILRNYRQAHTVHVGWKTNILFRYTSNFGSV